MKNVVIITHIPFWRHHAGHAARVSALVRHLSGHTNLTVVFGGMKLGDDEELLRKYPARLKVAYLDKYRNLAPPAYAALLRKFLETTPTDVCIIEYLELSFLLEYIPRRIRVMLDTHDLLSERSKSFSAYFTQNEQTLIPKTDVTFISEEAEFELFDRYDKIILINETDYQLAAKVIGREKLILASHPVRKVEQPIRPVASRIGYVASEYWPNVDAISVFLKEVWPVVFQRCTAAGHPIALHIHGNIASAVVVEPNQGILVKGYTSDLDHIYGNADIIINPIRYGAGIKIKNLEAIGNGLPLVTTPHGARGLEAGMNRAFLVAEDSQQFSDLLMQLIGDYELRKLLSQEALQFTETHFTPDVCFRQLLLAINGA